MINSASLRQLAQDYYEGRIDRAYYVEQRRHVIESLVGGHAYREPSPGATDAGLFQISGEAAPDSTDLANALANRDSDPLLTENTLPDQLVVDPHITAPMDGNRAETLAEPGSADESGVGGMQEMAEAHSPLDEVNSKEAKPSLLRTTLLLFLLLLTAWYLWQQQ
jgi:hypothetical protein